MTHVLSLRHTLATLAYRAGKVLRSLPPGAAGFEASPGARTPLQILAHMGDLMEWALSMVTGSPGWRDSTPLAWEAEVARFVAALEALDSRLALSPECGATAEKLFQGPVADALTHTGQIALLSRLAGSPVKGENYFVAKIEEGRVGVSQADPVREF